MFGEPLRLAQAETGPSSLLSIEYYMHPQRLVAVNGLRHLNLFCVGKGNPIVLFEAGLGDDTLGWRTVQGSVGQFTTACSYDRAGYGYSDASTRASDALNTVDDLHHLLHDSNLSLPIVLVGHSIGGLYATFYASTFPDDVAGMVLVDPSFAGQERLLSKSLPGELKQDMQAQITKMLLDVKDCLEQARSGDLAKSENERSDCLDNPPDPDPIVHAELNRQWARPQNYVTNLSEWESSIPGSLEASSINDDEVSAKPLAFGEKPLIVLTSGKHVLPPGSTSEQMAIVEAMTSKAHASLAASSKKGKDIYVPDAGHYIQKDNPDIVVKYIESVVVDVRQDHD